MMQARWSLPKVNYPRQTRFCASKEEFHEEYGLSLEGQDPKLLTDQDFTDAQWLSVWTQKRHINEKTRLRNLRPEFFEECVLLYHQVYQTAPPNNEVSVHFANGFTYKQCRASKRSEDKDRYKVCWAIFAEGVTKTIMRQKKLNQKMEKWRIVNGPCYGSKVKLEDIKSDSQNLPSDNGDDKSTSF